MWHVYTTDGYSALKGKGIQTSYNTEVTMLNEMGQSQECVGEKNKARSLVSDCRFCRGEGFWDKGEQKSCNNMNTLSASQIAHFSQDFMLHVFYQD